mmetsp:Transcript_124752/g.399705  ORF Transcript_124752/g.399705 Transcript_124752/m.399705 type:complete len:323 (-) Transcript_124752:822-1790(-)
MRDSSLAIVQRAQRDWLLCLTCGNRQHGVGDRRCVCDWRWRRNTGNEERIPCRRLCCRCPRRGRRRNRRRDRRRRPRGCLRRGRLRRGRLRRGRVRRRGGLRRREGLRRGGGFRPRGRRGGRRGRGEDAVRATHACSEAAILSLQVRPSLPPIQNALVAVVGSGNGRRDRVRLRCARLRGRRDRRRGGDEARRAAVPFDQATILLAIISTIGDGPQRLRPVPMPATPTLLLILPFLLPRFAGSITIERQRIQGVRRRRRRGGRRRGCAAELLDRAAIGWALLRPRAFVVPFLAAARHLRDGPRAAPHAQAACAVVAAARCGA